MSVFELYLIFQASTISSAVTGLAIISGMLLCFIAFGCYVVFANEFNGFTDTGRKIVKTLIGIFAVTVPLAILTPDTESLIAIYGIHETIQFTENNEEFQKLPDNVLKYMNTYLEEKMKDNKE